MRSRAIAAILAGAVVVVAKSQAWAQNQPAYRQTSVSCPEELLDPYEVWKDVYAGHVATKFVTDRLEELGSTLALAEWLACSQFDVSVRHWLMEAEEGAFDARRIEAVYMLADGAEPLWDGRLFQWPVIKGHRLTMEFNLGQRLLSIRSDSVPGWR